ncbi:MAG: glycosyltransferase [Pseudomonadota bacterium]
MAIREMLHRLATAGYSIGILGAGIFDAPVGTIGLEDRSQLQGEPGSIISIKDGPLEHITIRTADTDRESMTALEQEAWFRAYQKQLDRFRPDLVYFYGGHVLEMMLSAEARRRGIPTVAYLANGNYHNPRWCHDVNLVLTDSRATSEHYRSTLDIPVTPVGAFISPERVIAERRDPRHVLIVNPSLAKGAAVAALVALQLESRRPDITFEVVESRGNWQRVVQEVTTQAGHPRDALENVIVTPNTNDMRPIYGRARLLLALSLWWESYARVVIEALYNGIPPVISDHGGPPEAAGRAAIKVQLPEACHRPPYTVVPSANGLEPLLARIERCQDDEDHYATLAQYAYEEGKRHRPEASERLLRMAIDPFLAQRAGDRPESGS